jgi:WD40 repeat protein
VPEDLTPTTGPVEAAGASTSAPPASPPGYELQDEIGRGGMGVVYRARDTALDRDVAVKLLSEGYPADSPAAQRFRSEARITGQLQHPGIPAVHQFGTLADGRPFLAMKLIRGTTLADILQHRTDPSADRGRLLAIFEAICHAVGYAHAHRVIHRDLKPANVMVGRFGEVQVMDWGLAKVLTEEVPLATGALAAEATRAWTEVSPTPETGSHTQAGSLVGTAAFIPPEQALGEIHKVNERSDVFGLGAVLAVILTGQPPYVGASFESVRVQAARGKLEDCFARLDACGAEPELIALCKRCLAFEPAERPADAGAVAAAVAGLRAAADARAQRAELESAAARARELEARKRQRLTLALVAALLVGAGAAVWLAFRAEENARRADEKTREAESTARRAAERAYLSDIRLVQRFWDDNLFGPFLELLQRQRPERTGGLDLRGFEWFYWDRQKRGAITLRGHAEIVHSVAYSPDCKRIVSGSDDYTVKVWDADKGKEVLTLKGHTSGLRSVAYRPDGKRIVSGSMDKTLKVWDAETGKELLTLKGHTSHVRSVAYRPDGKRIVSGSMDKTLKVWDAETGKVVLTLKGHTGGVTSVGYSQEGNRIVSASDDYTVKVWDADKGQEVLTLKGHAGSVISVAYSPDGKRLVSGSRDNSVKVWDAQTGKEIRSLKGHTNWVWSVAWSPDSRRIGSGSVDNTIKLWDAETGQEVLTLKGHTASVVSVGFSPDGKRIVSGSEDNSVKVWSAERDPSVLVLAGHLSQVTAVALGPDGAGVASAGGVWDGELSRYAAGECKLWNAGGEARDLLKQETGVTCVAFSPDGALLACGSGTWDAKTNQYAAGEVRLFSAEGRPLATLSGHSSSVLSLAFSPDGGLLASSSLDGSIRVWDVTRRQKAYDLPGQQKAVTAVVFSPDGALLAAAGFDAIVTFYDLRTRELAHTLATDFIVSGLAFSPDGARLAVAGYSNAGLPVYEVATGKRMLALMGYTGFPTGVAYSPDGRRIATGGEDRMVRLWDAASGQEVLILKGHTDIVRSVAFSKDGHRLVSGGWDRTVRVWDATPLGD